MNQIANITNEPLRGYEIVIEGIKSMLLSGTYKAGDKLPSERDLAARFNISRVPVHEAIKVMEYIGVVDSSRGDGTYVRELNVTNVLSKMDFAVSITAETMRGFFELRIELEASAAYYAALRRTDEDLEQMRRNMDGMRNLLMFPAQNSATIDRIREYSSEFHRCVIRAAKNQVLSGVYANLYELLDISRQLTANISGVSDQSAKAHEGIYDRIAQRDCEGARLAMTNHLDVVRIRLESDGYSMLTTTASASGE